MGNPELVVPSPEKDLQAIAELTAAMFSDGKYLEAFRDNYIGNSHYDWQMSRIGVDGGRLVHHWGVWRYEMRLDDARLKIGGIGAVATHPDYRQRGLMHQAAQASFEAMRQAGYDLSILRGRHYAKIGYARAWNYVTYRLKKDELARFEHTQAHKMLTLAQVPAMDGLYNVTHQKFSATAVRPTFYNRHPDDMGVYAWFDDRGELAGYVRCLPDEEMEESDPKKTLVCLEAAGDPLKCLGVLNELCQVGGYEGVSLFSLPHLHPLLQVVRKGACVVENRFFDVSGWRVRLVNLMSCLEKLTPILEKRLAQSLYFQWSGDLLLEAGAQRALILIERGKVQIGSEGSSMNVLHAGADMARLLIGSDEPGEVIRQADMVCEGKSAELVGVLFPNLYPMLSHWDEF